MKTYIDIEQRHNVRLISWLDGYHIYAKVDNEDVVDSQGNQKWSWFSNPLNACYEMILKLHELNLL